MGAEFEGLRAGVEPAKKKYVEARKCKVHREM
jgi:hypothetical protein